MHDPIPDLLARSLLAATPVRGGRVVPHDPRGGPELRPAYPRLSRPASGTIGFDRKEARTADTPGRSARRAAASLRVRLVTSPADRAAAGMARARVALAACARREAARTVRP